MHSKEYSKYLPTGVAWVQMNHISVLDHLEWKHIGPPLYLSVLGPWVQMTMDGKFLGKNLHLYQTCADLFLVIIP
jgi:hypothetical protein